MINANNWSDHIIRHELIHHLQTERFGIIAKSEILPRWYIEGMAYALSKDPRQPLPRAGIEGWRAQYLTWQSKGNSWETPPASPA